MKMKDKNSLQKEARKKHIESIRDKRRSSPSLERKEPSLSTKPTILIVCEGQNTEPSYFNQFKLSTATVKAIGEGYNTITLVDRALILSQEKDFDQIWCVFDKDDFSDNDFNNAIAMAEANEFGVAYSNQAFEYWLILHFDDHQGNGMHRNDYHKKINSLLKPYNFTYDGSGSKIITEDIFEILSGFDPKTGKKRILLAIERAERNYENFKHLTPSAAESSTTVFRLVSELLKYL